MLGYEDREKDSHSRRLSRLEHASSQGPLEEYPDLEPPQFKPPAPTRDPREAIALYSRLLARLLKVFGLDDYLFESGITKYFSFS